MKLDCERTDTREFADPSHANFKVPFPSSELVLNYDLFLSQDVTGAQLCVIGEDDKVAR